MNCRQLFQPDLASSVQCRKLNIMYHAQYNFWCQTVGCVVNFITQIGKREGELSLSLNITFEDFWHNMCVCSV